MSKTLYDEAIDAAEQIKFATEQKVKQQLIESLSPKIKLMVEKSFLDEDDDEDKSESLEEQMQDEGSCDEEDEVEHEGLEEQMQDECGYNEEDESKQYEMSENSKRVLSRLLTTANKKAQLRKSIKQLKENFRSFYKTLIISENTNKHKTLSKKIAYIFKNLVLETKLVEKNVKLFNDKSILNEYIDLIKEIKNMSRRQTGKSRFLNESLDDLLEMNLFEEEEEEMEDSEEEEDMEDSEEEDMEDSDEEDSDEEMEFELPDDMGSSGDISSSTTIADLAKMAGLMGDSEEESEEDMEDSEEESEEVEEGMDEMYEVDMDEEEMPEAWGESRKRKSSKSSKSSKSKEDDEVLEIDESMLRREIKRMRALREGEASSMASHFGGGKLGKEHFVDVDDSDLNVHSGHLGREDVPSPKVESLIRKAVRKNRMLESKIQQYKEALSTMKGQLSEMNLFNAKLLYANKLMQNRDLSVKQQKNIVESLDNAKTLGEAKILFESLSKSLAKTTTQQKTSSSTMNESVSRNVGASSRPVQSAQVLNESVALDRWATLAGIKK
jgi:hypothetical protein